MISIFIVSNIITLFSTVFLQLWGICCIFIYGKRIRNIDKILFLIPLVIPVKSFMTIIQNENDNKLRVFLKTVTFYKLLFFTDLIVSCLFVFMK